MNLTLEDFTSIINRHITEDQMVYLIVGDKASQWDEINQLGKGKPVELDIFGNAVSAK
jgi:zinc protease